jgi:hypothetical protein
MLFTAWVTNVSLYVSAILNFRCRMTSRNLRSSTIESGVPKQMGGRRWNFVRRSLLTGDSLGVKKYPPLPARVGKNSLPARVLNKEAYCAALNIVNILTITRFFNKFNIYHRCVFLFYINSLVIAIDWVVHVGREIGVVNLTLTPQNRMPVMWYHVTVNYAHLHSWYHICARDSLGASVFLSSSHCSSCQTGSYLWLLSCVIVGLFWYLALSCACYVCRMLFAEWVINVVN